MYLGIEIGGTKLQLALSHGDGTISHAYRYVIDASGGAEGIKQQIKTAWESLPGKGLIKAIGVGFGGPVNWQTGTIEVSHQVSGWAHFNLREWLRHLTGKPVAVENDANVAALAEAVHGAGKTHRIVFYSTIGSGIGGGLITDGNIYHGRTPGEVEVGHLRLNKKGDTLESKCSGWAINKRVRAIMEQYPDGLLAQASQTYKGPEAALLQPALERADAAATTIINDLADDIAFALSHVVHLFHPHVLIVGGGLSLLGKYLLEPINQRLPQYVMPAFHPPPPVVVAALGEQVVPVGAIELAKRSLL